MENYYQPDMECASYEHMRELQDARDGKTVPHEEAAKRLKGNAR